MVKLIICLDRLENFQSIQNDRLKYNQKTKVITFIFFSMTSSDVYHQYVSTRGKIKKLN